MTTPFWARRKRTMTNVNQDLSSLRCDIAMSRIETTILTPTGDVLVCRSRDSEFMKTERASVWMQQQQEELYTAVSSSGGPHHASQKVAIERSLGPGLCFMDDSFCNPCAAGVLMHEREGLLGGAATPEEASLDVKQTFINHHVAAENTKENTYAGGVGVGDLIMPPSFDYSHLAPTSHPEPRKPLEEVKENNQSNAWEDPSGLTQMFGNLMAPSDPNLGSHAPAVIFQSREVTPATLKAPSVMHGVPTCLPTLSEIRITQISANPLGSHVLLISSQALLFSYGQNDYGQLGLGLPLDTFVRTPTIVTAILEGGGKAVSCSAGVCHSLIVVKTEEQRVLRKALALQRAASSPSRLGGHDANSSLTPNNPDDLVLYHHQVYGFGASRNLGLMNQDTNAAACVSLPHRVALHAKVWPEREASSVEGLPPAGVFQVEAALNHSAALVRRATGAIELYTWGEQSLALGGGGTGLTPSLPTKVECLSCKPLGEGPSNGNGSYLKDSEHLQQVYLGPDCTFVMTNTGRCMSFGTNQDGLLGIGKSTASVPTDISFPREDSISSISIGAQHATATSCNGKAYVWGADPASRRTSSRPEPLAAPTMVAATAFAGYDASALVTQSGIVQTCGQKSGRLGQGEVPPNPRVPTRLFGGLRLWREQLPTTSKSADV